MKMPQGYIIMFEASDREDIQKRVQDAIGQVKEIAAVIERGAPLASGATKWSAMSHLLNPVFYPAFIKATGFHTGTDCSGCGVCVAACPLNNIHIEDRKPQWGSACTHCRACISSCPQKSIEYGRKTIGKKRYRCDAAANLSQ